MKIFCFGMAMAAHAAIAGGVAYNVGRNLLANPDFAMNNGVDADGWEHVVQFGTNAVMRIVKVDGQPGIRHAAEMFFTAKDRAVQTRYKQTVPFETNTVYELEYSYQSGMDGALHADVMMTGSGPMYRSFSNMPSAKWTRVRRFFATPEEIQIVEGSIFLFQNRSMVPIRYANGSLRATDIKPEDVGRFQPSLSLHSVTANDQLILPGGGEEDGGKADEEEIGANVTIHGIAPSQGVRHECTRHRPGRALDPFHAQTQECSVAGCTYPDGRMDVIPVQAPQLSILSFLSSINYHLSSDETLNPNRGPSVFKSVFRPYFVRSSSVDSPLPAH